MGRPSKATPARIEAVCAALRAGATREAAAVHAGIDRSTLFRWMQSTPTIKARIEKAEADLQLRLTATIVQASATSWRAAAYVLERRFRRDWGPVAQGISTAHDGDTAALAPHPLDGLSLAEQAEREAAWAASLGAEAAARVAAVFPGGPA